MIYVSIILNIVLLLLLFVVSRNALDMYSRIEESFSAMESFREHLDIVHNLDTFYGDETLGALLEHSRELSDFLGEIQEAKGEVREEDAKEEG
tara:strand:+ start:444 stop:722 length:279 start_codon:yes stop_codon:yes gene_type:complete